MNLVITEASTAIGGQELAVIRHAKGLTERGHRVRLLVQPGTPIERLAVESGLSVRPLRMPGLRPGTLRECVRILREERPHILHVNSSRDSWLGALAARLVRPRIPVVKSRHISAPLNRNLPTRVLYRDLFDHVIVTGGPSGARALVDRDGLQPSRVSAFPIGVDVTTFRPGRPSFDLREKLGVNSRSRLVGIVSYLRSYKGHRYLVEAAAQVLDHEQDVTFLIVGEGPEEETIRHQIEALGIETHVLMLGYQDDILSIIRSLDLFVMPSIEGDTIPQVMLEVMATGVPVIATTTGSIPDVMTDGVSGLLVPPRDSTALGLAIRRLLGDPSLRQALAQGGSSLVSQHYSLDAMLDRLEAVYTRLVGTAS